MLMTIAAIMVPYLYAELGEEVMAVASTESPFARAASRGSFIYLVLLLFALFYLLPLGM
jgi:hypothetical protein